MANLAREHLTFDPYLILADLTLAGKGKTGRFGGLIVLKATAA